MTLLVSAFDAVATAISTGHIGTPVAVRVVAHLTPDHGLVSHFSALCLDAASDWLRSSAESIATAGRIQKGQVTALTRYQGGQTALVSVGSSGTGSPAFEVVVVGSRGVLTWNGGRDLPQTLPANELESKLSPAAKRIQTAFLTALENQRLVKIDKAGNSKIVDSIKRVAQERQVQVLPRKRKQRSPFGVLLVAGDHTHQPGYSAALAADGRCKLIGLTDDGDLTPERKRLNQQFAKRLGIEFLPDLETALARDDVHIVSICAEPIRRGRIIVAAAKAGKHLYLDKPLVGTLADADAVVAAVEKANVVSHMFTQIHWPAARRARQIIRDGALGELVSIHCDLFFAKGSTGTAKLDESRREDAVPHRYEWLDAKRELTNVGVYPVAMVLWLLGKKARSVSASTGNYFFAEHEKQGAEDFGQILIEFEEDVTASISVGRTGWRSHPAGGFNRTYLSGTKQTAVVDAHDPHVEIWADVDAWQAPARNPDDPMGMWGVPKEGPFSAEPKQAWITESVPRSADVTHFLDCIEQGRDSEIPARLAAAATEILLAGYRSAAEGRIVELPLPRT